MTPLCECHGVPKFWAKDDRGKHGGYWRCNVKKYLAQKRWKKAHPDAVRANNARSNSKQIYVGRSYFGVAASPERAAEINTRGREMLAGLKAQQKEARIAAGS